MEKYGQRTLVFVVSCTFLALLVCSVYLALVGALYPVPILEVVGSFCLFLDIPCTHV